MIGQPRDKTEIPELPGGAESKEGSNVARQADTRTVEQKAADPALVKQASKVTNAIDPESKPPDKVMDGTKDEGLNVEREANTTTGLGQPR